MTVITPFFPSLGGFLQNFLYAPNDAAVDGDAAVWSLPSKQTKFGGSILWNTEDQKSSVPGSVSRLQKWRKERDKLGPQ